MTIGFPNHSRSYDAARRRIRFWGHVSALEVTFFLEEDAIFKLCPRTKNVEAGILAGFDTAWARIQEVAGKLYARGQRRAFYVLAASDF